MHLVGWVTGGTGGIFKMEMLKIHSCDTHVLPLTPDPDLEVLCWPGELFSSTAEDGWREKHSASICGATRTNVPPCLFPWRRVTVWLRSQCETLEANKKVCLNETFHVTSAPPLQDCSNRLFIKGYGHTTPFMKIQLGGLGFVLTDNGKYQQSFIHTGPDHFPMLDEWRMSHFVVSKLNFTSKPSQWTLTVIVDSL